jgi:hypothetical protein
MGCARVTHGTSRPGEAIPDRQGGNYLGAVEDRIGRVNEQTSGRSGLDIANGVQEKYRALPILVHIL